MWIVPITARRDFLQSDVTAARFASERRIRALCGTRRLEVTSQGAKGSFAPARFSELQCTALEIPDGLGLLRLPVSSRLGARACTDLLS